MLANSPSAEPLQGRLRHVKPGRLVEIMNTNKGSFFAQSFKARIFSGAAYVVHLEGLPNNAVRATPESA